MKFLFELLLVFVFALFPLPCSIVEESHVNLLMDFCKGASNCSSPPIPSPNVVDIPNNCSVEKMPIKVEEPKCVFVRASPPTKKPSKKYVIVDGRPPTEPAGPSLAGGHVMEKDTNSSEDDPVSDDNLPSEYQEIPISQVAIGAIEPKGQFNDSPPNASLISEGQPLPLLITSEEKNFQNEESKVYCKDPGSYNIFVHPSHKTSKRIYGRDPRDWDISNYLPKGFPSKYSGKRPRLIR